MPVIQPMRAPLRMLRDLAGPAAVKKHRQESGGQESKWQAHKRQRNGNSGYHHRAHGSDESDAHRQAVVKTDVGWEAARSQFRERRRRRWCGLHFLYHGQ